MLKSKIFDIGYARISTSCTKQISSLGNQVQRLKDLHKCDVVTNVNSGEEEFPEELKNKIIDAKNKNYEVRINVTSFNRLTRNFTNMDFLVKNVRYIYVLDEKKQYDVKNERLEILSQINTSYSEIEMIRNNAIRHSNLNKLAGTKHPRSATTEKKHDQIFNSRKRCTLVADNLIANGISEKLVNELEKFIDFSQNLNNLKKWNGMFDMLKTMGLDIRKIKKEYQDYIDKCENKKYNTTVRLQKSDVLNIVSDILKKNKYECDTIFLNHFVNTNIRQNNL